MGNILTETVDLNFTSEHVLSCGKTTCILQKFIPGQLFSLLLNNVLSLTVIALKYCTTKELKESPQ